MFVNIANLLACLPSDQRVRLSFDYITIEGRAGNFLDDDLLQMFDLSTAITNSVLMNFEYNLFIIKVYDIHPATPSD